MDEDTEHEQCVGDDQCPRPGRRDRGGLCWFHDLNGATPRPHEHTIRLEGSYQGHRPIGW